MKEVIWAKIGKIIVFAGVVVGLIVGAQQIFDRLQSPKMVAAGEVQYYHLNPKIKELFIAKINKGLLISSIQAKKKQGESAQAILNLIETSKLPEKSLFDNFELMPYTDLRPMQVTITVKNNGSDIARDVKLMFPGEGIAEVEEVAIASTTAKVISWNGNIPIDDIRPQGTVEIRIWPKAMIFPNLSNLNPTITYSKGSVKVRDIRSFYGWDADLVFWFISLSMFLQACLVVLFFTLIFGCLYIAWKRGHIVLKPIKKHIIDSGHDEGSGLESGI